MTPTRITENQRRVLARVRRLTEAYPDGWVPCAVVGQAASVGRLMRKGLLEGDALVGTRYVRPMGD